MTLSDLRPYLYVILGEIPLIAVLSIAAVVAIKQRQKAPRAFGFAILAFALMLMSIFVGMTYAICRLAEVIQVTKANLSTFGHIALASGVIRLSLQTAAWALIILAFFTVQRGIGNHPDV